MSTGILFMPLSTYIYSSNPLIILETFDLILLLPKYSFNPCIAIIVIGKNNPNPKISFVSPPMQLLTSNHLIEAQTHRLHVACAIQNI